jgi:putative aldouronate transport system substrate-binding protein
MSTRFKALAIIALALLCAGALWAAGAKEAPAVTLTWYYVGSYPQKDQDLVYEQFNTLLKQKMNTTIDFKVFPWGDYDQKMQAVIASGEKFDLCFTANWINNYLQNVSKGAFIPLDDLLTKYAPKLKASVPDKIWAATKVNGKIYGIINYQISAMTSGLSFPTSLIKKYNFDPTKVKKLEDIEPYMKVVKAGEPDLVAVYGVANTSGTTIGYVNQYLGFEEIGGRAIPGIILDNDPTMKVVNQFKTDKFKNWIKLERDWYLKGYIMKDAVAVKDMDPNLSTAKVGVSFVGNYKPGGDAESAARYGYPITEVPISDAELITSSIISTMHAISITSPNPERAMAFMELMNTDKAQYNLLTFGIEGKHYTKTGANSIALVKDSAYNPGTPWMHASTFNAFLLPGQPADVWEKTKTLNMTAKASPIIGFSFNPEPVQSEIAQCQSVRQEYLPALELGTVDPDTVLPEFLDKLDQAGAQKIIDEMQKQINAWKGK